MVARAHGHMNVIQVNIWNVIHQAFAVVRLDIIGVAQLVVTFFILHVSPQLTEL
jgi:hypothetical protein